MITGRPFRYIVVIGLVAISYFIFGLLGLLLKVPPSNAGGLWPPAGISLAAMLLLGPRIWPGIFIGNFCISAYAFGFTETSLPIYVATGFGATCCALVGTALIKRFVGFPTPLTDDRSILLFMLLGGPLSCLIPASIGIAAMVLANIVTAPEITVNWVSWWVGDTIGVLVFTPLMLAAFAQPKTIWTKRRISVGIPLLISFTLVVIFFFYVRKAEQEQHHQQLLDQSITLSQALKNRIAGDFRAINAITNFFIGSHSVEAKEFSLFSVRTLSPFKEIKAIRWFPINNAKTSQTAFTTLLNNQTEAPSAISQHVLDRVYGTQETEYLSYEKDIINFSTPVFSHADNTLLGYIVTSITIKELVQQALEELNNHGCFLTISAKNNSFADPVTIYSSHHTPNIAPYKNYLLQVANQQWQVNFYHDLVMENSRIHWSIWWVLISGLLFTSSLGIGLLMLTGRHFQTESIVDERTADLLKAKNTAETANKAKSQFLANISHELRTPLNGIVGFTRLIQKKSSLAENDKKQIEIIKQCSDHLLTLITDLLDIAAIESSQLKININDFDFEILLSGVIDIFKLQAEEKKLPLIVINAEIPHLLKGDEKRIRQIITNLLNNAIKYTDQGQITISSAYQGGHLKLSVVDTGPGIAEENLTAIFSPFVQINPTDYIREGVGLGLAITRELVNSMHGELSVTSCVGAGSVFSISIPLPASTKKSSAVSYSKQSVLSNQDSLRVLIADDNDINLLLLANLLELQDCVVDAVSNGKQALQRLNSNHYDLALIDLNMPLMTGLELVKMLREQHNRLHIVAISAYADEQKISEALSAGFDFYLTKPVDEDQLIELLRHLRGHL